jgi:peptide/nickel transport system substrate-binding protein
MAKFTIRRRTLSSLAIIAVAAMALSACSNSSTPTTSTSTSNSGGVLTLLEHNPRLDSLDPTRIYTGRDIAFETSFLIRTLVSFDHVPGAAGTSLVPDLATDTGVPSNSAKTWTFTLRPGSTFQDGSSITCADVKYGASRVFAQDVLPGGPTYLINWLDIPTDAKGSSIYAGPYKSTVAGIAAYDKAVTCSSDNRTIAFHLKQSVGDFNYLATYPVISPVQKSMDTGDKYDLMPQATGPYMIKVNSKAKLQLVRNPKWSQASDPIRTPLPDQVVINFGMDQEVMDQIILSNSIPGAMNFDGPLPTNLSKFFNNPNYKGGKYNEDTAFVGYLAFNLSKVPCLQIREAMYYSRDAKAIQDYQGGATYGGAYVQSIISPLNTADYAANGIWGPANKDWMPAGNVVKAQALMDQAKTACPADYAKATTKGLTIDVRQVAQLTDTIPINQAAWARVGIKVNYNPISAGYYPTVMNPAMQSDLSTSGWSQDWPNASTVIPPLYTPEGGFDLSQNTKEAIYPTFHKQVLAAIGNSDRVSQAKQWKALEKMAAAQFWVLPTTGIKNQETWGTGVHGVYFWLPQATPDYTKIWVTK